jgi:hypothetical protein
MLEAPPKRIFSFENAAHVVAFEQYEAFQSSTNPTGATPPASPAQAAK